MDAVIEVRDLRKRYGETVAVDGISFDVKKGEIFGMVGPNGAGKTSTIECLEGLRQPSGGTVRVLGLSPHLNGTELRERIGVQQQESNLPDRLKVWEAMDLFASFYKKHVPWVPLLTQLGLTEKSNTYFANLSGGQKQRLFIALALINQPELVFLDELTTGLDPQARLQMWDLVEGLRNQGQTVFLTTHFMAEAERLCDRVAIIDHGQIIALDTPQKLIRQLPGQHRVLFEVNGKPERERSVSALRELPAVSRVEQHGKLIIVYGQQKRLVSGVIALLEQQGTPFQNLRTQQPTLEDVFLAFTGRQMRE